MNQFNVISLIVLFFSPPKKLNTSSFFYPTDWKGCALGSGKTEFNAVFVD